MKKINHHNVPTKKNASVGSNAFGDSCIIKRVSLVKETAVAQYVEILNDIEQHKKRNVNIEYEIEISKDLYSQAEIDEMYAEIRTLMLLRSRMNNGFLLEGRTGEIPQLTKVF